MIAGNSTQRGRYVVVHQCNAEGVWQALYDVVQPGQPQATEGERVGLGRAVHDGLQVPFSRRTGAIALDGGYLRVGILVARWAADVAHWARDRRSFGALRGRRRANPDSRDGA